MFYSNATITSKSHGESSVTECYFHQLTEALKKRQYFFKYKIKNN